MNLQHFLEVCMDVERVAANIYEGFVDRFVDDADLRHLWQQMAQDEHAHAMQLKLAITTSREGIVANPRLTLERVREVLKQAQALQQRLLPARPSAVEALTLALRMEEVFGQAHLLAVAEVEREDLKAMFRKLARADEEHIGGVRRLLSVYGGGGEKGKS